MLQVMHLRGPLLKMVRIYLPNFDMFAHFRQRSGSAHACLASWCGRLKHIPRAHLCRPEVITAPPWAPLWNLGLQLVRLLLKTLQRPCHAETIRWHSEVDTAESISAIRQIALNLSSGPLASLLRKRNCIRNLLWLQLYHWHSELLVFWLLFLWDLRKI